MEILEVMLGIRYIIETAIIFGITLAVSLAISFIIRRIYNRTNKKHPNYLHTTFVKSLARPLHLMIWILGFSYILDYWLNYFEISYDFSMFRDSVIIVILGWFCFNLKRQFRHTYVAHHEHKQKDLNVIKLDLISKLGTIFIIVFTLFLLLSRIGINLSAIIAFGGVGGLAVGFAAKGIIGNFFGGIMIYITRPFKVGDWISSPMKELEGTVEEIGYYMTKIRSFDKRPIYVPNGIFAECIIVNPSRMTNRRIKKTVGVRYDDIDKVPVIVEQIKQMLKSHKGIDQKLTTLVNFTDYGDFTLNILIYTFTKTKLWKDWLDIQQDVLLKVGHIILENGAQIAFPTTTLDVPDETLKELNKKLT